MSRGFVKEDDQEEIPLVPQRAYLPEGVTNFVTPFGMNQLLAEKQMLVNEKNNLNNASENEKRIALNYINAKLQLLNNRIVEAKIVNLKDQPQNEIRFGAMITLKIEASKIFRLFKLSALMKQIFPKGKSPLYHLLPRY